MEASFSTTDAINVVREDLRKVIRRLKGTVPDSSGATKRGRDSREMEENKRRRLRELEERLMREAKTKVEAAIVEQLSEPIQKLDTIKKKNAQMRSYLMTLRAASEPAPSLAPTSILNLRPH
eukprot:Hpha_TRINITY_DN15232_c2_g11::TRINITY_DN15232_c2_g11_i1::g.66559::m.66559